MGQALSGRFARQSQYSASPRAASASLNSSKRPYLLMLAAMVVGIVMPFFPGHTVYAQDAPPLEPVAAPLPEVGSAEAMDTPIPVVSEIFSSYDVSNGLIHWSLWQDPPIGAAEEGNVQAAALGDSFIKRKPTGGGPQTTLAQSGNFPSGYTFKMMQPDAAGVAYVDPVSTEPGETESTDRIIWIPGGDPTHPVVVATPTGIYRPNYSARVATDATYVYWSAANAIYRARKDGATTTPELVADGLINEYGDLLVVGSMLYYTRGQGTGTGRGLFSIPTTGGGACPQPAGPCGETTLSPNGGYSLVSHYHAGARVLQSSNQIYWVDGERIRYYSCPVIAIIGCGEGIAVDKPDNTAIWSFGRPSFSGNTMFFVSTKSATSQSGVLHRRADNGTGLGDDLAVNFDPWSWDTFVDGSNVYFTIAGSTPTINKLSTLAAPIVRDLRADNIEVTQAIQNLANNAPLVAKKLTYVRAYGSNQLGPVANGVPAKLYGTRNGNPLPGSPLSPVNGTRSLAVGASIDRAQTNAGWLFQIPQSWTNVGTTVFRVDIDPANTYSDSNAANNEKSVSITFQDQPVACNVYVPVDTHQPTTSTRLPNFWDMVGRYQKVVPFATFNHYTTDWQAQETEVCWWGPFPYPCGGPFELNEDISISDWIPDRDEAIAVLWAYDLVHYVSACDGILGNSHYMGMVHPSAPTGNVAGYASTISMQSWVKLPPFSPNPFPQAWNSMFESGVMAQELAHNYGRKHINCPSGTPDTDGSYPYPPCQIAPTGQTSYYGFDTKTLTPIRPDGAKDYMSYSSPVWTSDYTWRAILNATAASDAASSAEAASPDLALIISQDGTVIASGFIDTQRELGQLNSVKVMPAGSMSAAMTSKVLEIAAASYADVDAAHGSEPHTEGFHLQLLDAAGTVLEDRELELVSIDDHDEETASTLFASSFPAPAGVVAKVRLLHDTDVLDEYGVGTHAPVINITAPAAGASVAESLTVAWNQSDADHDNLLYNLQYSYDNGVHWQALAGDVNGTPEPGQTLIFNNLSNLHGSATNQALVRVIASDGYNTTIATSQPFTLSNRKPMPYINDPGMGQIYDPQLPVILSGGATDAEDGALEGSALTWKLGSTAPGMVVGTGSDLALVGVAPGVYTATIEAKDSNTQVATYSQSMRVATLSIPLLASTPTVDGVCDDAAYASGSQIQLASYDDGNNATLLLGRDANYLYGCFTGLKKGSGSPIAQAGLSFDVNNSDEPLAMLDDSAFLVGEDGGVITYSGNGIGGFEALGPGGLNAQVSVDDSDTFWRAELRIEKAKLGGWDHLVGMAAGHRNVNGAGDDYVWPALPTEAASVNPQTWGTTALGSLPIINAIAPFSATVGGPDLTLVIEGDHIAANPLVLYNGVPYTPTTNAVVAAAVDGNEDGAIDAAESAEAMAISAATVLTVSVPAAQVGGPGAKSVVVQNPGPLASSPSYFNVNSLQPTITSLAPASTRAGSATFVLTVNGSDFVSGATVYWNGVALPTTFMAGNKLTAQVSNTLLGYGGVIGVTVLNPAPTEAGSDPAEFNVEPDASLMYLPVVNK